jgi:Tfp pilus assembly protein PilV
MIISVGLLSVLVALTRGMTYVQKTRQKVVALALAKEGMEAVYHIRDTNWTRWA